MSNQVIQGYLDTNYLSEAYLSGLNGDFGGMQVDLSVVDNKSTGMQSDLKIVDPDDDKLQGMQVDLAVVDSDANGVQVNMNIIDEDDDFKQGMQVELSVTPEVTTGMQAKIFPLAHWLHPKYLDETEGYLEYSYLAEKMCAFQGMQTDMKIASEADDFSQGMQTELRIDKQKNYGMQVSMKVVDEENYGMQSELVKTFRLGSQANLVIYNTTQLRFLCDFASRGLADSYGGSPGGDNANWTTPQSMRSGDLGKLGNLNNDKVEQRVQTSNGVIGFWELRCDTGQNNTFVDTIGILNHNFTTSASVIFQASLDSNFSTIEYQETLTVEDENMYFIAPTLPTTSGRYFRFLIQDSTNTDNYLRIGTIVFGTARIFTLKERFENPVGFGKQHFKDTVRTEGYSSNSNDRATRKKLNLSFQKMNVDGGNFGIIRDYADEAKTDLKCLIIPTPKRPSLLAVFSKLVQMPDEQHYSNDEDGTNHLVDVNLDWDESL